MAPERGVGEPAGAGDRPGDLPPAPSAPDGEPDGEPGRPLRVAMVCPYSLTIPGGVQEQALGLARALRRRGHHVRVLAPCDGPPPDPSVIPLGRSVPTASNGSVAPIAPDVAAALRTLRALRDTPYDVYHLHEPLVPGPTLTTLITRPGPLVGTFHRAGRSREYDLLRPAVRRLVRRLDVRCAVSEDARALAASALGGSYTVLWNGIDTEAFSGPEPWPTEGPTVLFVGRHEPRKGLEVLLEALDRLPPEVRVWVAGTGPRTGDLRRRWGDDPRVTWLGRIDDLEKRRRMAGAHVFCAPSLGGESFGVILLEAMAAGTPVVASDLPGYRNVATHSVDALLVPPGDPAALAAAIRRVLADPDLAARLAAAGRRRAAALSMERLADRYVDLYRRAIRTAARPPAAGNGRRRRPRGSRRRSGSGGAQPPGTGTRSTAAVTEPSVGSDPQNRASPNAKTPPSGEYNQ